MREGGRVRLWERVECVRQGDDCVEVALTVQVICVRDSKDVTRPHFAVGRKEWARFVGFAAGA
ncbi:DUF397 domain-containing protein [Streptomyces sp. NPDC007901]|uniref:DUF397 domain-containing protein n=1 Tax=Streptomyces sp. NPDC007901 TaxID=3364785 RepID=UPI0036E7A538